MNPKVWGHITWSFLINLVLRYPDRFTAQDARQFQLLFGQLGYVLPCNVCKLHYSENLILMKPTVNSKLEVLTWLKNLYNHIGKKNLSLDEFVHMGDNYNKTYFWKMIYYIVLAYPDDNSKVSFDTQLQYKQFFEYLFDMIPLRHLKWIPIDQYMIDNKTLRVWYNLIHELNGK